MEKLTRLERSLERYQGLVVGGLAFILVFAVSMAGVMLWQAYKLGAQSHEVEDIALTTHSALCAFRVDLQNRHDAGVVFLKQHPFGLVSGRTGEVLITSGQLQSSLDSQQAALDALAKGGLNCDTGGVGK